MCFRMLTCSRVCAFTSRLKLAGMKKSLAAASSVPFYNFTLPLIRGAELSMSSLKDKVVLIVNSASH